MPVKLIAACGLNGVIGNNGELPWKLSSDLKRFKLLTTGNSVIMGRKTFESLPNGPLPLRENLVVSSQHPGRDDILWASSLELALYRSSSPTTFIIGGQRLFEDGLKYADEVLLTLVYDWPAGDVFFPLSRLKAPDWKVKDVCEVDDPTGLTLKFFTFSRK